MAKKTATGYLALIEAGNSCPPEVLTSGDLYRLYLPCDDNPRGLLRPSMVNKLPWTSSFRILHNTKRVEVLDSSDGRNTSTAVTEAFAEVIEACLQANLLSLLSNFTGKQDVWRTIMGLKNPVRLYRYAQPVFGIVGQGAHLTAFTHTQDGMKIWVPRRGGRVDDHPYKLDNTAAGSVPAGLSVLDAMVRQADEEASLPPQLIRSSARPGGAITYVSLLGRGPQDEQDLVIPDVIYVYDIELREDVIPKPREEHAWEVKEFYLMGFDEVKAKLLNWEFKPNCALVMIDFFVRHGIITADDCDYIDISMQLHRQLPLETAVPR